MRNRRKNLIPNRRHGKPEKIETIVNTTAIGLTSGGIILMQLQNYSWIALIKGFVLILFGGILEYFKYMGRNRLW